MNTQMSINDTKVEAINQLGNSYLNLKMVPELENLPKVNIIQEVEFIDCICYPCTQNKYGIVDPNTEEKIFDLKENGLCLERFFCFPCRGFMMKINNTGGNIRNTYDGEKGCSLPCLLGNGCGQPSIKVTLTAPNNKFLGSVKMDYENCCLSICSHKIIIRNEKKETKYYIQRTSYCIGCYCECFPKCCDILYHIYEGSQAVGEVKKVKCSSCYTFCPKGDNYSISFPPNASPEEKFLIIIGVILLDYISFYC